MNTKHAPLLALCVALFAAEVTAHGMWTETRRGNIEAIYGHGAEDDAFDAKKISGAWAWDAAGRTIPVTVERLPDHARFKPVSEPATLAFALDNGYWTQDAEGTWHNKGEREVEGAKDSGRYYKYGLTLYTEGAKLPPLDDLRLAIVPTADPLHLKAGDRLPVQVLVDSKPAEGIELIGDYVNDPDAISATTDAEGRATLTVRNNGLNVIGASTTIKQDDPDARVRGYFGSLTFVTAEHTH